MSKRQPSSEAALWQQTLAAIHAELAGLPAAERHWLQAHLRGLGALQERLHAYFLAAEGSALCRACDGACCGCGRNHLTLGNLLAILLAGAEPPPPDWSAACPWLAPDGCRLEVARRPFNCVSFVCEAVEERLSGSEREAFYAIEKELRVCLCRAGRALCRRRPAGPAPARRASRRPGIFRPPLTGPVL